MNILNGSYRNKAKEIYHINKTIEKLERSRRAIIIHLMKEYNYNNDYPHFDIDFMETIKDMKKTGEIES